MALPLRTRLLFALVPLVVLAAVLEIGARVLVDAPPPRGSRGEQFREYLIRLNDIPHEQTDRLLAYDPELFWRLRPDTPDLDIRHARDLWPDVATNALGLRDDPVALPKPPGTVRVLCVGDSCTYGTGVRREQAWTGLLDERLGPAVDVVNAGVPGWSAWQAVRWLERDGLQLEPDVVVLTVGFNDARSWDDRSDAEHAAELTARTSGLRATLERSRFVTALLRLRDDLAGRRVLRNRRDARTAQRVPRAEYGRLLARAARLADEAGAHVLYVLWPVASNLESARDLRLTGHQKELLAFGRRSGHPVVDLIPPLRPHADAVHLFDDVHMTPRGNALVADAVEEALRQQGWIAGG